MKLHPKIYNIN